VAFAAEQDASADEAVSTAAQRQKGGPERGVAKGAQSVVQCVDAEDICANRKVAGPALPVLGVVCAIVVMVVVRTVLRVDLRGHECN
jgi:hypothetical protein